MINGFFISTAKSWFVEDDVSTLGLRIKNSSIRAAETSVERVDDLAEKPASAINEFAVRIANA